MKVENLITVIFTRESYIYHCSSLLHVLQRDSLSDVCSVLVHRSSLNQSLRDTSLMMQESQYQRN